MQMFALEIAALQQAIVAVATLVRTTKTKGGVGASSPARGSTPAPRPNPDGYGYNRIQQRRRWRSIGLFGLALVSAIILNLPLHAAPGLAQSPASEASRLTQQAIQLYQQYQYDAALNAFQQVLQIVRQTGDRAGEAATLTNIGQIYISVQQYPQALDTYEQALAIAQSLSDRQREGEIRNNIGDVYSNQEQYTQALQFYQQALTIRQELGDRAGEQITLNNIGFVHSRQSNYPQALQYYQQALAIAKASGDRAGEGVILNNIGRMYTVQGQYSQALETYQQSLAIRQGSGDRAGEATLLNNIGSIYDTLGQYPPALEYYNRAIELLREVGNRSGEAKTLNNIGLIYNRLGQDEQALAFYQQSLQLRQALGDRAGEGASLNNIGSIYSHQERYPEALEVYQQALTISQDLNDRSSTGTILGNLGVIYDRLGQIDQALEHYKQALTILRDLGDRNGQATTLGNLALLLSKQNQPELAIAFYKQSVNLTEAIRQDIRTLPPELQQSYTATVSENYRRLGDLLLQQDRVLEAQQVLDLLKVQELEDYLQDVQGNSQTAAGLEYWPPEQQMITLFERSPDQSFADFLASSDVAAQIEQMQRIAQGQNVNPNQLIQLQNSLKSLPNAVLFYPLVLPDRLELVLVTPNSPPIRRTVPIPEAQFNQAIAQFRAQITNRQLLYSPAAQQLYRWLIQPIEPELQQAGAETILYAADGQLHYVPLGALYDGEKWLIQRFRINYITAASLTDFGVDRQTDTRVLAAAFSDTAQVYQFQVGDRQFSFSGLPAAGVEVQNIASEIPATTELLNQNFSLAAVSSRLDNYTIIHLATHAEFVSGQPEDSFIVFGNGDRATLRDVATWHLPHVDLVVLSACKTAVGEELGNGEEILGFGYQIQRTGARAAIASLWSVDDGGTQMLMTAFYKALQRGNISKAEALRQAQMALITDDYTNLGLDQSALLSNHQIFSRPYYWAPFILIGNGL
ncbi:MAG TPA: tetratricopeptide repeat protein [Crinalium sp.]